jgi:hypothetical protein
VASVGKCLAAPAAPAAPMPENVYSDKLSSQLIFLHPAGNFCHLIYIEMSYNLLVR